MSPHKKPVKKKPKKETRGRKRDPATEKLWFRLTEEDKALLEAEAEKLELHVATHAQAIVTKHLHRKRGK